MRKVFLIRHGRTRANDEHIYCGWTDLSLSENGVKELGILKNSGVYPDISGFRVITSGMKRTEQTMSFIYGDISHEIDGRFREMNFGVFEMKSYEELKNRTDYSKWLDGDNDANICPGGESGNIMSRRALEAFKAIKEDNAAVFTHGGVIAAIMAALFPEEKQNRYQWQPPNGMGYEIEFYDGKPVGYSFIGK